MKKKEFAIIPYNSSVLRNKYLVSNILGAWDFLDKEEFSLLHSFRINSGTALFKRLHEKGIIVDELNINRLLQEYRRLNANLFTDTSLHIAVITTRCNLSCKYCQTKTKEEDMGYEVAQKVIKSLFDVKNSKITLEFQGGEPVLNWDVLAFLIENSRKFCKSKDLRLALVTNATLLDRKKMAFLDKFEVEICVSLDGPNKIHDKNRILNSGKGTYKIIVNKICDYNKIFNKKIHLLPTVTKDLLNKPCELIDEYVKLGQREIALRPINKIGAACNNWHDLGYSPEDFNKFYAKGLDYILELNKKGVIISERIGRVILEKIINKNDAGYVDLMNPCGAGRSTIVYMPDGSCYPCDESRMVNEEMFKLGNILNENYVDLMQKEELLNLLESSIVNLWDGSSVFLPWSGTCPVVNYATQNNVIPKIACSSGYEILKFQFKYIFEKIMEDDTNLKIFKSWIGGS